MLKAGFGKSVITPKVGVRLMGYANRAGPSVGIHDDLYARAIAVASNGEGWALCTVDLCYLREPQVRTVREIVAQRTRFKPENIFLCAIHTHSGPDDQDKAGWDSPLTELIANAVVEAIERMRPATVGVGAGFLYGWSINRRWLDRPVDPYVGVLRVDDEGGNPMGVVSNFGCHAVVLGYDNLLISADWPGETCEAVEKTLGPQSVCIVTQGGSGDVNPLTEGVRSKLQSGNSIGTMKGRMYYGNPEEDFAWHIGDRGGGTFEEAKELGKAVAEEILRVTKSITTKSARRVWNSSVVVNGSRQPDETAYSLSGEVPPHIIERPNSSEFDGKLPMELMMVGIGEGGFVAVGQPGEVFAETAVEMRRQAQSMGYDHAWTIGYANGWQLYLPPESAFPEGGYEVDWAIALGITPRLQNCVRDAIHPTLIQHAHE
jgi:neutral ceramidase